MTAANSPIRPALFEFLSDLQQHNHRDWFAENRQRYEQDVREPVVQWLQQWVTPLARSAPFLSVVPTKSRGSLMRIHRDTRFSRDKTPYKTNVGISLRHQGDGDIHGPGVYVHLAPEECFVGAGCWRPDREVLRAIRNAIDDDPKAWKRSQGSKFRQYFELAGDQLKTSPRDYPKDHPMIEDLRRTDFIGVAMLTREDVLADDATDRVIERIRAARPFIRFLCDAVDLPY